MAPVYPLSRVASLPSPRIAFFDVDGTLVGAQGELAAPVQNAIHELSRKGVRLALATGRPWFAVTEFVRKLGITAPSMTNSGALIVDPTNGKILRSVTIEPTLLDPVIAYCRSSGVYWEWYTSDEYFVEKDGELTKVHFEYLQRFPQVTTYSGEHSAGRLLKLVLVIRDPAHEHAVQALCSTIPGIATAVGVGAAHPDIRFLNIVGAAATRQSAWEWLMAHGNVAPQEVLAFGDADADVHFLSSAGWGTAMGNAPASVRACAPFTTHTVDQGGIAVAVGEIVDILSWREAGPSMREAGQRNLSGESKQ